MKEIIVLYFQTTRFVTISFFCTYCICLLVSQLNFHLDLNLLFILMCNFNVNLFTHKYQ